MAEPKKKGKETMLMKTNFPFNVWLSDIRQGLLNIDTMISEIVCIIFNRLPGETNTHKMAQGALVSIDRRKPTYVQLRNAWNKLDSASQKEAVEWLFQKTLLDPLSGLETLVAREMSGSKPDRWVEVISDVNGLKAINDTWGHETGSEVIRVMGKIVKAEVMEEGGRAFRVGGDEVSYWFPDMSAAKRALARIDTKFQSATFVIGDQTWKGFSLSYGIGADVISADNALYQDKERRKELGQRSEYGQMPSSIDTYS
jgi:diguanylate cyclase (GGDEF)-like protein